MAHASTSKEQLSPGEAAGRDEHSAQGGSASSDGALDDEEGNALPLLPSKLEAEGRSRSDDREAGTEEEAKSAKPEPERGLSRLQSINLL